MATVKKPAKKMQMGGGTKPMMKKGGSFPDLNKDGKITKADILKGRGVIAKKGTMVKKAQNGVVSDSIQNLRKKYAEEAQQKRVKNAANAKVKTKQYAAEAEAKRKMYTSKPTQQKKGGMTKTCKYGCK